MSTASETTSRTGGRGYRNGHRTLLVVSNPSPNSDSDSDDRGDLRLDSRVPSVVSAPSPSDTSSPPPITPSHQPHPVADDNPQIKMQMVPSLPPPVRSVRSPDNKTIILVTSDSDHFATVQITGFTNAAFIKELIFAKLQIPDEDYARYSIYRTDIDAYATSGALSDDELYNLCVEEGDSRGSLRLLVATSSAAVHNPAASPGLSGVPPPPPPPLQTSYPSSPYSMVQHTQQQQRTHRHRSTSRHGSVSSRSERLSQLDDLEDDGGRRGTLRPPARPQSPPAVRALQHVRTGSDVGQQNESEREKVRRDRERMRDERERRNRSEQLWATSVDSPTTPSALRTKQTPTSHYPSSHMPPTPSTPPSSSGASALRRQQNEQRKKVPLGWVTFTGAKATPPIPASASSPRRDMRSMRSMDSLRDAGRHHPGALTPGSGLPNQPQSRPTVPPLPSLPSLPQ
ncbi:unnamed protein product, partial [Peniophora sp. CBMAI 1063]